MAVGDIGSVGTIRGSYIGTSLQHMYSPDISVYVGSLSHTAAVSYTIKQICLVL